MSSLDFPSSFHGSSEGKGVAGAAEDSPTSHSAPLPAAGPGRGLGQLGPPGLPGNAAAGGRS